MSVLYKVIDKPCYLKWWILSDQIPYIMRDCEIMAKLVCESSLLKDHDYRLKSLSSSYKVCTQCMLGIREDLMHIIMQCPDTDDIRREMFEVLNSIEDNYVQDILKEHQEVFYALMGKHVAEIPFESMIKIWRISSKHVSRMCRQIISKRQM